MKKAFLAPLAVLAAALAAGEAQATPEATISSDVAADEGQASSDRIVVRHEGDVFGFILRRNDETGQTTSYHESHYSHGSHGSHRSHTSGY